MTKGQDNSGQGMIQASARWSRMGRFHQATQKGAGFKTYELFISGMFHVIFSDYGQLKSQKWKLWRRGTTIFLVWNHSLLNFFQNILGWGSPCAVLLPDFSSPYCWQIICFPTPPPKETLISTTIGPRFCFSSYLIVNEMDEFSWFTTRNQTL